MFIAEIPNTLPAYLYLTLTMLAVAAGLYVAGQIIERRQENRLLVSILDVLGYGRYVEVFSEVRLAYECAMVEAAEDEADARAAAERVVAVQFDRQTLEPVRVQVGAQWRPVVREQPRV